MTEWDFLLCAQRLKEKQEKMMACYTKITDALSGLKKEAVFLSGIWKGNAKESFMSSFWKIWEEADRTIDETGKLIAVYAEIEKGFEDCENTIMEMDY